MKMKWPITIDAETHDGKRVVRMHKTMEGAGDANGALLRAVQTHPRPGIWLGVEIKGVTPLGQLVSGIYEWDGEKHYIMHEERVIK